MDRCSLRTECLTRFGVERFLGGKHRSCASDTVGEEIGRGREEEITDEVAVAARATKIRKAIKEQCGLSCSIGIGITKSVAKIASDFQKP